MSRIFLWASMLLVCSTVSYGQYYTLVVDSQDPAQSHVIPPQFSGNTPFLKSLHYDDGVPIDLTAWSMEFDMFYAQFDTNGVFQIPGVVSATNLVTYLGATNIFYKPRDYWFSIKGLHLSGYVKTFATGKITIKYDPATSTNVFDAMGAMNISWWTNNVGAAVVSNTASIATLFTQKVDVTTFNASGAVWQAEITANLTNLTAHTTDVSNPHTVTADQVGAVKIIGDIMTGPLTNNSGFYGAFSGTNYVMAYSGEQTLTNGATITPHANIKVDNAGGLITLGNPQIGTNGISDGAMLVLRGAAGTGGIQLTNGNGIALNCTQSFLVEEYDALNFVFLDGEWQEFQRIDK